jgi:GTP cyclohydrolase II
MGHIAFVPAGPQVTRYASATLPTRHGTFQLDVYRDRAGREHLAVHVGDLSDVEVLCRVHSECWTSEVLGSLKCDCRAQLDSALERIAREGRGVVVYLRQEGRGIGLGDKIRAYALQDEGADTVEANVRLGLPVDARRYDVAAAILKDLGVTAVALMTNNPDKIAGLSRAGIRVTRRVAHWLPSSIHSARYLATKRSRLGHLGLATDAQDLADAAAGESAAAEAGIVPLASALVREERTPGRCLPFVDEKARASSTGTGRGRR